MARLIIAHSYNFQPHFPYGFSRPENFPLFADPNPPEAGAPAESLNCLCSLATPAPAHKSILILAS